MKSTTSRNDQATTTNITTPYISLVSVQEQGLLSEHIRPATIKSLNNRDHIDAFVYKALRTTQNSFPHLIVYLLSPRKILNHLTLLSYACGGLSKYVTTIPLEVATSNEKSDSRRHKAH